MVRDVKARNFWMLPLSRNLRDISIRARVSLSSVETVISFHAAACALAFAR